MRKYIFNHTLENPLVVDNYPYGFKLRTQIRYWIESTPKKGDRFCSQTLNPKNGRWNAPKKSTYQSLGIMFLDEKEHVSWAGVNIYSGQEKVNLFVESIGGVDFLNSVQRTMYNDLMGIREVKTDEFTGAVKKDYSVKWDKQPYDKTKVINCNITFDRTDGVKLREIFEAMRKLKQDKLTECFEGYESKNFGYVAGHVRVLVRGGVNLGIVDKDAYLDYLASDEVILADER